MFFGEGLALMQDDVDFVQNWGFHSVNDEVSHFGLKPFSLG